MSKTDCIDDGLKETELSSADGAKGNVRNSFAGAPDTNCSKGLRGVFAARMRNGQPFIGGVVITELPSLAVFKTCDCLQAFLARNEIEGSVARVRVGEGARSTVLGQFRLLVTEIGSQCCLFFGAALELRRQAPFLPWPM